MKTTLTLLPTDMIYDFGLPGSLGGGAQHIAFLWNGTSYDWFGL